MRIIVETVLLIILSIAIVAMAVVLVIVLSKNKNNNIDDAIYDASKKLNQDTVNSVKLMSDMINQNQVNMAENQKFQLQQMENRLKTFSMENEQKLENIRSTVEKKLTYMQEDNNKQLENIRTTVNEKLQNNLENKLNKSFETVSKQLQQVYKGLGEMQNLAVGVGDLKKVLSNVKTRGILGEIQLSAILKEILSPEQYEENVATKKGSRNVVEFAIKLPADDDSFVYLPIDSKFPGDTYAKLVDAMNSGNKEEIEVAQWEEREPVLIPDFTFHVLRHTFCTRMAENGMDVKVLQDIMGHSNIAVTMQVYNHVSDDRAINEMNKIQNVIGL